VVLGFFDTLYWRRQFRRHMDRKHSARMTAIPSFDIPDIQIDDEDDRARAKSQAQGQQQQRPGMPARGTSTYLNPEWSSAASPTHHRSWSGQSMDISQHEQAYAHPLSTPRSPPGAGGGGPAVPPSGHSYNASAFSFELHEPVEQRQPGSGESSRRASAVSPAQLREMLDDSVWLDSIRRSATQRRPGGY
jgi:voltage-dependent calcium channel